MTRTEHNCRQGSGEWFALRRGIPTASRFDDIVTPTGKARADKGRRTYLCQLLAERMTGQLMTNFTTDAMTRGTEMEPRARAWYEIETGRAVRQVGFLTRADMPGCGASPDGLVDVDADLIAAFGPGTDRAIEIKCGLAHTVVGQLLAEGPPAEYLMQCQAVMWLACVPVLDLVIFSGTPGLPNRVFEIPASATMQAAFAEHVMAFVAELDASEARLIAMGGVRQQTSNTLDADGMPENFGPPPEGEGR